jgi:hypothetical protein
VQLRKLIDDDAPPLAEIESRLRESRDEKVTLDETTLMSLKNAIERASRRFSEHPEDLDRLETYEELVSIVHDAHLKVNLRNPQNDYYVMRATVRPAFAAGGNGSRTAQAWLDLFDALGEKLSISPETEA